jgi:hypothetical protein
MSPDEERTLELLLKKREEESRPDDARRPGIRLIHARSTPDTPPVERLRELLRSAEAGGISEFICVSIGSEGARLRWAGPLSHEMLWIFMRSAAKLLTSDGPLI